MLQVKSTPASGRSFMLTPPPSSRIAKLWRSGYAEALAIGSPLRRACTLKRTGNSHGLIGPNGGYAKPNSSASLEAATHRSTYCRNTSIVSGANGISRTERCMHWHGVKDDQAMMTNSVIHGAFLKNPSLRREFLSLLSKKA